MSVFSVPVTIGVDEEKIANEIHNNVEAQVINKITNEVEKLIFQIDNWTGKVDRSRNAPLRDMIYERIDNILEANKDQIIELAANKLAERLGRSKAVKDMAVDASKK